MMFTFKAIDGREITVYKWLPEGKVKAVVQIAHGMAEHATRYERFAKSLNKEGYAVYANDHRGHGRSAESLNRQGYLRTDANSETNGFTLLIQDMETLTDRIRQDYPEQKIFLFSHSMGSFAAQKYLMDCKPVNGVILSGSNGDGGIGLRACQLVSRMLMWKDRQKKSRFVNRLVFSGFNDKISSPKTTYDWLTRDDEEVAKYIDDPYCGRMFPAIFFYDLMQGMRYVENRRNFSKIPLDIPILILSGSMDPVGDYGKGTVNLYYRYKTIGVSDVQMKLYDGARHELTNEFCHEEVEHDVVSWLDSHL